MLLQFTLNGDGQVCHHCDASIVMLFFCFTSLGKNKADQQRSSKSSDVPDSAVTLLNVHNAHGVECTVSSVCLVLLHLPRTETSPLAKQPVCLSVVHCSVFACLFIFLPVSCRLHQFFFLPCLINSDWFHCQKTEHNLQLSLQSGLSHFIWSTDSVYMFLVCFSFIGSV